MSLAVSKRSIFCPFGLLVPLEGLYSPLKSKKSLGRGRSPPCTPPSAAARRVRRCAAHGLGCAQPAVQRQFRSQTPIQRPFRPKPPISFICAVVPPLISGLLWWLLRRLHCPAVARKNNRHTKTYKLTSLWNQKTRGTRTAHQPAPWAASTAPGAQKRGVERTTSLTDKA
jgi:hypothetical protein